jgi:hypothetical protein
LILFFLLIKHRYYNQALAVANQIAQTDFIANVSIETLFLTFFNVTVTVVLVVTG